MRLVRLRREGFYLKQSNDVIVFEVNETLYFESGQEIAEMISISLDPEIGIQPFENYIQVYGLIVLQGEYLKVEENSNEQEQYNDDLTRYIEKVVDTEENKAKFSHRFPVEISVPPYRVENIEDVTVTIDSFDYEIPDEGKLVVKSSVHINGIKKDVAVQNKQDVQTEFDYDDKKVSKEMTHDDTTTQEEITDVEFVELNREVQEEYVQENQVVRHEQVMTSSNEIDIQLNESEEEHEEEVKDVRFLTELFGGEEEETYATMRIYIAQEDDTIETIAKQYGVSALQLMQDNNLSGEDIEEGQLLQLPVKTN